MCVAECSSGGAPTLEQLRGSEQTLVFHEPESPTNVIGPARALLLDMRHIGALSQRDDHPAAAQSDGVADGDSTPETAHVWLFPHAACYFQARAELQRQCELYGVQTIGRCAHWRRLELRGPRSSAVLAAVLRQEQQLESLDSRREDAVLAGWVSDPRLSGGPKLSSAVASGQQAMVGSPEPVVSAMWTEAEPLAGPMTDQQVRTLSLRADR